MGETMRRSAFALVVILGLAACTSSGGTQVTQGQINQFQIGKTTYEQVLSALGQPSARGQKADGSKVLVYTHTESTVRGATFVPVVGLFAGGADAHAQSVAFAFDTNNILKDYTTSQAQACTGNGVIGGVNASAQNCDKH